MILNRWPTDSDVLADNKPTPVWQRWLSLLVALFNKAPQQIGAINLTGQAGALATAAVPLPDPMPECVCRVSYGLEVTQAAPTASSAQVTIGWTYHGESRSKTFAAYIGNSIHTTDSNSLVIHVDAVTAITRAVAYASS